jgi:AraC-like DNA-binding protein
MEGHFEIIQRAGRRTPARFCPVGFEGEKGGCMMLWHSRLFRKFLVSYLVILILPSVAGYLSYRTSISVAKSISIENSVSELQKSKEILEQRIEEVKGFTRQLALNQNLIGLMSEKKPDKQDVYGIWRLMKDLTGFSQTNDFLQNFFIYLNNYDVLVMPGTTYYRADQYYESFHYPNVPFEEWKRTVLERAHSDEITPLRPYMDNGVGTSAISYLQSLPLNGISGAPYATVDVIIDGRAIARMLSALQEKYGGWVYVGDRQGRPIGSINIGEPNFRQMISDPNFDSGKESQFYGDDLVISITSKRNGWVYMAGIPKSVLMESADKIKFITWTVTGIALGFGLLAGFVLSYRNSLPINKLLGLLQSQFGKDGMAVRNEYDFLQGNISAILKTNKNLQNELIRQLPVIRDAFLKRLLAGEFLSREEIVAAQSQADLRVSDQGCVGILQINGYPELGSVEILNELNAARFLIKQALANLDGAPHVTDSGPDKLIVIFGHDQAATEDSVCASFEQWLAELSSLVFEEYKITFTAALGKPFSSLMEVSRSYDQANQVAEFAVYTNRKGIVRYGDMPSDSTSYYYPLEYELRLINTIRAGDKEEAWKIVRSIMDENANQRVLSTDLKRHFIGELQGTFIKLLDQNIFKENEQSGRIREMVADLQLAETAAEIGSRLESLIAALCSVVIRRKNDLHMETVEQIKKFIDENYADPDLTLYRIAEQVGQPEKYISQLFKDRTGVNLSSYLEKVRLDRAVEFLRRNECTVDEIASQVGYNSSHSFRRAFKRVMGVSPSAYRGSAQ